MPLLDHFHSPLLEKRKWESMHSSWANAIMAHLNEKVLPADYFAETQISLNGPVEVDVATREGFSDTRPATHKDGNGALATLTSPAWAPPHPSWTMPLVFPEEYEVLILGGGAGPQLVAAVELVSPGNKDQPETRRAFAAKCAGYLHAGVGLVIVDIVTHRTANLHDELISLLKQPGAFLFSGGPGPYASAYRPVRREGQEDSCDIWPERLAIGNPLPVLPLALKGGPTLPLDLEIPYMAARQQSRL